jgi:hypothetical protein
MRRDYDGTAEAAAFLVAVVVFVATFCLLCGRVITLWAIALLSRTFRAYGKTAPVRCWLAASLGSVSLSVLVAVLTASAFAWVIAGGLVGTALVSLAILEQVLNHVAGLPPEDVALSLGEGWPEH